MEVPGWWEDEVTGKTSKILAICNVCGDECTPQIQSIMNRDGGLGCRCTQGIPWTKRREEVFTRVRELNADPAEMEVPEWWENEVTDKTSKILATCKVCGAE
jgi:hypothetical protein